MLRRAALSRSTPLIARTGLVRKTGLNTYSTLAPGQALKRTLSAPKPARDTGPTTAVRELVYERADRRCERCGTASGPFNVHHRTGRGMGGTSNPAANSTVNLVLVCGSGTTGCHGEIESHRRDALADGWLVPRTADPANAPVKIWSVGWVQLLADGHYEKLTARRAD